MGTTFPCALLASPNSSLGFTLWSNTRAGAGDCGAGDPIGVSDGTSPGGVCGGSACVGVGGANEGIVSGLPPCCAAGACC